MENYVDVTTKITFRRGLPTNSTLHRFLHKKKLEILEESFMRAYKFISLEEDMIVSISKVIATTNMEQKKLIGSYMS